MEQTIQNTSILDKILCLYCPKSFPNTILRKNHVEREHCCVKGRRSSRIKVLNVENFENTIYPGCFYCNNRKCTKVDDLDLLFNHLLNKHRDEYFGCKSCKIHFDSKNSFLNHNKNCKKSSNKCVKNVNNDKNVSDQDQTQEISSEKCDNNSIDTEKSIDSNNKKMTLPTTTTTTTNAIQKKSDRNKTKQTATSSAAGSSSASTSSSSSSTASEENNVILTRRQKKNTVSSDPVQQNQNNRLSPGTGKSSKTTKSSKNNGGAVSESNKNSASTSTSPTKITRSKTNKVQVSTISDPDTVEFTTKPDLINTEFDDDFYKNIGSHVRTNLNCYIDGKIDRVSSWRDSLKNSKESLADDTETVTLPTPQHQQTDDEKEIYEATNFIWSTPFPALLTVEQYGSEDLNTQKIKRQITKNSWKWKWDLIKKYKYVNEGGKIVKKVKQITTGQRDLSKLDMWTQLSMRSRYEKLFSQSLSNFEDNEEINDQLSLRTIKSNNVEQLNSILENTLLPEILNEQNDQTVIKIEREEEDIDSFDQESSNNNETEETNVETPELLRMFDLTKTKNSSSSSIVLSGDWARPRCYICFDCGQRFDQVKSLEDHKNSEHPYVVSSHYEIVGRENIERKFYKNLFLPKKALITNSNSRRDFKSISETNSFESSELSISSESSRFTLNQKEIECTKCQKMIKYVNDTEIYRHILDCIGDHVWMQAKRRMKYRRSRRRRGGNRTGGPGRKSKSVTKETDAKPESKPEPRKSSSVPKESSNSDDFLQRMLADLPPKRNDRKSSPKIEKPKIVNTLGKSRRINDKGNIKKFFKVAKGPSNINSSNNSSSNNKTCDESLTEESSLCETSTSTTTENQSRINTLRSRKSSDNSKVEKSSKSNSSAIKQTKLLNNNSKNSSNNNENVSKKQSLIENLGLKKISKVKTSNNNSLSNDIADNINSNNAKSQSISSKENVNAIDCVNGSSIKNDINNDTDQLDVDKNEKIIKEDIVGLDVKLKLSDEKEIGEETPKEEHNPLVALPTTSTNTSNNNFGESPTTINPSSLSSQSNETTTTLSSNNNVPVFPKKKKVKKLNDCIAMLTCKLQEKLGVNFFENVNSDILRADAHETESEVKLEEDHIVTVESDGLKPVAEVCGEPENKKSDGPSTTVSEISEVQKDILKNKETDPIKKEPEIEKLVDKAEKQVEPRDKENLTESASSNEMEKSSEESKIVETESLESSRLIEIKKSEEGSKSIENEKSSDNMKSIESEATSDNLEITSLTDDLKEQNPVEENLGNDQKPLAENSESSTTVDAVTSKEGDKTKDPKTSKKLTESDIEKIKSNDVVINIEKLSNNDIVKATNNKTANEKPLPKTKPAPKTKAQPAKKSLTSANLKKSLKVSIPKSKLPNLSQILSRNQPIVVNNITITVDERRAFEEQKNKIMQILNKTNSLKKSIKEKNLRKARNADFGLLSKVISDAKPQAEPEPTTSVKTNESDKIDLPGLEKILTIEKTIKATNRIRCRRLSVAEPKLSAVVNAMNNGRKLRTTNNSQQNGLYDAYLDGSLLLGSPAFSSLPFTRRNKALNKPNPPNTSSAKGKNAQKGLELEDKKVDLNSSDVSESNSDDIPLGQLRKKSKSPAKTKKAGPGSKIDDKKDTTPVNKKNVKEQVEKQTVDSKFNAPNKANNNKSRNQSPANTNLRSKTPSQEILNRQRTKTPINVKKNPDATPQIQNKKNLKTPEIESKTAEPEPEKTPVKKIMPRRLSVLKTKSEILQEKVADKANKEIENKKNEKIKTLTKNLTEPSIKVGNKETFNKGSDKVEEEKLSPNAETQIADKKLIIEKNTIQDETSSNESSKTQQAKPTIKTTGKAIQNKSTLKVSTKESNEKPQADKTIENAEETKLPIEEAIVEEPSKTVKAKTAAKARTKTPVPKQLKTTDSNKIEKDMSQNTTSQEISKESAKTSQESLDEKTDTQNIPQKKTPITKRTKTPTNVMQTTTDKVENPKEIDKLLSETLVQSKEESKEVAMTNKLVDSKLRKRSPTVLLENLNMKDSLTAKILETAAPVNSPKRSKKKVTDTVEDVDSGKSTPKFELEETVCILSSTRLKTIPKIAESSFSFDNSKKKVSKAAATKAKDAEVSSDADKYKKKSKVQEEPKNKIAAKNKIAEKESRASPLLTDKKKSKKAAASNMKKSFRDTDFILLTDDNEETLDEIPLSLLRESVVMSQMIEFQNLASDKAGEASNKETSAETSKIEEKSAVTVKKGKLKETENLETPSSSKNKGKSKVTSEVCKTDSTEPLQEKSDTDMVEKVSTKNKKKANTKIESTDISLEKSKSENLEIIQTAKNKKQQNAASVKINEPLEELKKSDNEKILGNVISKEVFNLKDDSICKPSEEPTDNTKDISEKIGETSKNTEVRSDTPNIAAKKSNNKRKAKEPIKTVISEISNDSTVPEDIVEEKTLKNDNVTSKDQDLKNKNAEPTQNLTVVKNLVDLESNKKLALPKHEEITVDESKPTEIPVPIKSLTKQTKAAKQSQKPATPKKTKENSSLELTSSTENVSVIENSQESIQRASTPRKGKGKVSKEIVEENLVGIEDIIKRTPTPKNAKEKTVEDSQKNLSDIIQSTTTPKKGKIKAKIDIGDFEKPLAHLTTEILPERTPTPKKLKASVETLSSAEDLQIKLPETEILPQRASTPRKRKGKINEELISISQASSVTSIDSIQDNLLDNDKLPQKASTPRKGKDKINIEISKDPENLSEIEESYDRAPTPRKGKGRAIKETAQKISVSENPELLTTEKGKKDINKDAIENIFMSEVLQNRAPTPRKGKGKIVKETPENTIISESPKDKDSFTAGKDEIGKEIIENIPIPEDFSSRASTPRKGRGKNVKEKAIENVEGQDTTSFQENDGISKDAVEKISIPSYQNRTSSPRKGKDKNIKETVQTVITSEDPQILVTTPKKGKGKIVKDIMNTLPSDSQDQAPTLLKVDKDSEKKSREVQDITDTLDNTDIIKDIKDRVPTPRKAKGKIVKEIVETEIVPENLTGSKSTPKKGKVQLSKEPEKNVNLSENFEDHINKEKIEVIAFTELLKNQQKIPKKGKVVKEIEIVQKISVPEVSKECVSTAKKENEIKVSTENVSLLEDPKDQVFTHKKGKGKIVKENTILPEDFKDQVPTQEKRKIIEETVDGTSHEDSQERISTPKKGKGKIFKETKDTTSSFADSEDEVLTPKKGKEKAKKSKDSISLLEDSQDQTPTPKNRKGKVVKEKADTTLIADFQERTSTSKKEKRKTTKEPIDTPLHEYSKDQRQPSKKGKGKFIEETVDCISLLEDSQERIPTPKKGKGKIFKESIDTTNFLLEDSEDQIPPPKKGKSKIVKKLVENINLLEDSQDQELVPTKAPGKFDNEITDVISLLEDSQEGEPTPKKGKTVNEREELQNNLLSPRKGRGRFNKETVSEIEDFNEMSMDSKASSQKTTPIRKTKGKTTVENILVKDFQNVAGTSKKNSKSVADKIEETVESLPQVASKTPIEEEPTKTTAPKKIKGKNIADVVPENFSDFDLLRQRTSTPRKTKTSALSIETTGNIEEKIEEKIEVPKENSIDFHEISHKGSTAKNTTKAKSKIKSNENLPELSEITTNRRKTSTPRKTKESVILELSSSTENTSNLEDKIESSQESLSVFDKIKMSESAPIETSITKNILAAIEIKASPEKLLEEKGTNNKENANNQNITDIKTLHIKDVIVTGQTEPIAVPVTEKVEELPIVPETPKKKQSNKRKNSKDLVSPVKDKISKLDVKADTSEVHENDDEFSISNKSNSHVNNSQTADQFSSFSMNSLNDDSLFNDDNETSDKFSDIVNNIINSELMVDLADESLTAKTNENVELSSFDRLKNIDRTTPEPSNREFFCVLCCKSFRSDKSLIKHNLTATHIAKQERYGKSSKAKLKAKAEKEPNIIDSASCKSILEDPKNIVKDVLMDTAFKEAETLEEINHKIRGNDTIINEISDKISFGVRTKGALKNFDITNNDQMTVESGKIIDNSQNESYSNKFKESPENSPSPSSSSFYAEFSDRLKYPRKNLTKINKLKETTVSIPTKSLIMGKIFKKQNRDKVKTDIHPVTLEGNSKGDNKNPLDDIFDHLKNTDEIDDKVLDCPSPRTLLKSSNPCATPENKTDLPAEKTEVTSSISNKKISKKSSGKKAIVEEVHSDDCCESINCDISLNGLNNSGIDCDGEEDGIGKRKSRRKCAVKAKTLAETWSSDEYEEFHNLDVIALISEIEKADSTKKPHKKNVTQKKVEHPKPTSKQETNHLDEMNKNNTDLSEDKAFAPLAEKNEIVPVQSAATTTQKSQLPNSNISVLEEPPLFKKLDLHLSDKHDHDDQTDQFEFRDDFDSDSETFDYKTIRSEKLHKTETQSIPKDSQLSICDIEKSEKIESEISECNEILEQEQEDSQEVVEEKICKIDLENIKPAAKLANSNSSKKEKEVKVKKDKIHNSKKSVSAGAGDCSGIQKIKKKHRKRPRNKPKNIAYDSDSDFELNLSKKSRFSSSDMEWEKEKLMIDELSNLSKKSIDRPIIRKPPKPEKEVYTRKDSTSEGNDDLSINPTTAANRTKRHSSEKLYYWSSSSSEAEPDDVKPEENGNNGGDDNLLPQHGWIVGDSHKKLVTLLAHAKIKNKIN